MTIHELLEHFRSEITTPRDRGTVFERLMQSYLQKDPLYKDQFKSVSMWSQWEYRFGNDNGIDLVAEGHDGEFTAIQCKFFSPDHLIQKDDINSFFAESGKQFTVGGKKKSFAQRIIISTSDRWSEPAEKTLDGQTIPVNRIHVRELEQSPIDWSKFSLKKPEDLKLKEKKKLRPHQSEAIEKVVKGFKSDERGKLIMACGTGKTFTALKLAEVMTKGDGMVLFLVPSISLLSQTLREWTAETEATLHAFAVCSDSKVGKHSEDISRHDLLIPASTDTGSLLNGLEKVKRNTGMTVIFSTYQSIDVITKAQKKGLPEFDLIICDEAHRTTGVTLADEDESHFVKVHDQKFVNGKKRLYMTATPRVYGDAAKTKAEEGGAVLASMDNVGTYGREFHRLGFGKAVGDHLLTDYKVLVLAIDEAIIDPNFQKSLADENSEIQIEDMAKIIGCWNGLSKRFVGDGADSEDLNPMKRAVAFCRLIKDSKQIANSFQGVVSEYIKKNPDLKNVLNCELAHVDGSFNVLDRNTKLDWLKEDAAESTCRILTNARCLSEGVDVPALDAVLFLNPRDSMVDVVQSVGRIMRKAEGKKYGYVILPVGIPAGMPPEEALKDNKKYKVVWQVLQALRAHDDRFDAEVNKIELNKNRSNTIRVIGVGGGGDEEEGGEKKGDGMTQLPLNLPEIEKWRDAIYAKIVLKCGTRPYWEDWAKDVAKIAAEHTKQTQALLKSNDPTAKKAFDKFLNGIRKNLNPSISETDAIEMLSQQLITKPVFDALFEHYRFAESNSVSKSMDAVLKVFETKLPPSEVEALKKFYESVRMRVRGINNAEARQRVIKELYDRFFNVAFKKMSERLGIVYTPIEVVDFIIHSVEDVMQADFGKSLSDQGVHILDPFTGTGTFIVRLLQSGIIKREDLTRKFREEIHANELVLLAYYIASVNIEETYHEIMGGEYVPFVGGVLTDTFQLTEAPAQGDFEAALLEDHKRAEKQKKQAIRVVIGNPPYSSAQDDPSDDNKALSYPVLDERISSKYHANSARGDGKSKGYDSYIRAIRWATDCIGNEGIVGFVTNGAFIDSNSADGIRKMLPKEFSKIYIFNCRGNQRTSGEVSRQEGGKIFGSGSRTPVAISILVKGKQRAEAAEIFYHDIGDYLSREEKLGCIAKFKSIKGVRWQSVAPNADGDWINQRNAGFDRYLELGVKRIKEQRDTIFKTYSMGIKTNRDAWVYGYSSTQVLDQMGRCIDFYNSQVHDYRKKIKSDPKVTPEKFISQDMSQIKWTEDLIKDLGQGRTHALQNSTMRAGLYRPFSKQNLYFDKNFNWTHHLMPKYFPTEAHDNILICISGVAASKPFSALVCSSVPNLHFLDTAQCFPLYYYEKTEDKDDGHLFGKQKADKHGHIRRDAITDFALNEFKTRFGDTKISKEDIFYYVYGLLHSPTYRSKYQNDLKKMLPRIPLLKDFWGYSKTGRTLAAVHLNYETCKPYPLKEEIHPDAPKKDKDRYRVNEAGMRFPKEKKVEDKTQIIFNQHLRLTCIPREAYNYVVNGKSAIECVMERYEVTTDEDSGIKNDPNEWSDDPRHIVDLVKRVVTVSLETNKLVAQLPPFELLTP